MSKLFHRLTGLSMAIAGLVPLMSQAAAPASSDWYGRWTVSEDRPLFTARGQLYKTIDIAPCGNDFCGVSVNDAGRCGAVLFRFFGRRAGTPETLQGHGRWGEGRKNVVIYPALSEDLPAAERGFELYVGDGYDFGGRSENMPKFHANYARRAAARCTTR